MLDISKLQVGDLGFSFYKNSIFSHLIWKFSTGFFCSDNEWYNSRPGIFEKKLSSCRNSIYPKISHVFIYLGEGLIFESTIKGVGIDSVNKYLNGKYTVHFKRHYNFNKFNCSEKLYREICHYYDYKYSKMQILLFLIKKFFYLRYVPDYSKKEVICSELVAMIFNSLGLFSIKDPHLVTPYDLYRRIDLVPVKYFYPSY